MATQPVYLNLGLQNTHVLVTGAGGYIGACVVAAFLSAGAQVTAWDISMQKLNQLSDDIKSWIPVDRLLCNIVDVADEQQVAEAFSRLRGHKSKGPVQCCVTLAARDLSILPRHDSIISMSAEQWRGTIDVNVTGTFLTAREWAKQLPDIENRKLTNVSLIIVGSESGHFGERGNADYSTSKAAVQYGLVASLKGDIPRLYPGARVNAIAPGPVDTPRWKQELSETPRQLYEDAEATVALAKPVPMEAVARSIIYLASSNFSGSVHGQILNVDGGKQGKLQFAEGEASQLEGR